MSISLWQEAITQPRIRLYEHSFIIEDYCLSELGSIQEGKLNNAMMIKRQEGRRYLVHYQINGKLPGERRAMLRIH